MATATLGAMSSGALLANGASTTATTTPTTAGTQRVQTSTTELVEGISTLRIMHETHEQVSSPLLLPMGHTLCQFKQEIQTVQQQQAVELDALKTLVRNAQEMQKKLELERTVLIQRIHQLESNQPSALLQRPSALPRGLSSSASSRAAAASFVQTVLGIHYEPLGHLHPSSSSPLTNERARPVRLSAVHKDKLAMLAAEDAVNEPRRSSKRQKPVVTQHPIAANGGDIAVSPTTTMPMGDGEDTTIPLVAKSGTRIRLKPPKGSQQDDEASVDYELSVDTVGGPKVGMKRPRSPASSVQGSGKPPKKRNTTVTAARNKINIPPIPRGPNGVPLLPMQIGMFTLLSLGQIQTKQDLATTKALYPIGYKCERRWFSTKNPKILVRYTCSIEAGRDPMHPVFVVTPEDAPEERGHSATSAWWNIYTEGLRVRNQPEQAVMNGDEMFGLHDNVIKALLQELPGAEELVGYVWRTFVEGGPTTKRRNTAHTVYHIENPAAPRWPGAVDVDPTVQPSLDNEQDGEGDEMDEPALPHAIP
ncbi:SubName: Full=Uncharacterized protein {ECO:0000313/EMBL:CCA78002.1} [Serendipita indica DSM 11827]|nr:SubName: Full=Uncharacterized protein {ECO:0000313/EMBL:CCA78002.1} [Serendipita indica DSM 11827]